MKLKKIKFTKKTVNKIMFFGLPILTVACLVAVWALASKIIGNQFVLPSVADTVVEFFNLFTKGEFYLALLSTLLRSFIGFFISFIVAFVLALLQQKSSHFARVINLIVAFLRTLPTIAVVLIFVLWTSENVAPVLVTILVVLPTCYTSFVNALNGVDKSVLEMCRVDGIDTKNTFLKIKLPIILPEVLLTCGAGFSLSLKLMVASEVLSQTSKCIGYMLKFSQVYFETATMIALVVVVVILGVIIESTFNLLSKKASKWR